MTYGLITEVDARLLERSLDEVLGAFRDRRVVIVEIGVCHGDTSRGIKDWMNARTNNWEYRGVDNGRDREIVPPFDGAILHLGPSEEVYMHLPEQVHFVMADGCHCVNHVMLDFLHYGDRLATGGLIYFHDASPYTQRKRDWQGHGPRDHDDFGTATREAFRLLGIPNARWPLWREDWMGHHDTGGAAVFRKLW